MSVSSHRMIVLMIFTDLLLGLVIAFASSNSTNDYQNEIDNNIQSYNNFTSLSYSGMNTEVQDENKAVINPTFGDIRASGKSIWEIFNKGIFLTHNVGSCVGEDCTYPYVSYMWAGVLLLIAIVNLLGFYELYLVLFNKKTG